MSAPPRSTVMLPRLVMAAPIEGNAAEASARSPSSARDVPFGPGGGRLLSQALCLARVELPAAVCAHMRLGYGTPQLTRPSGLARALVAISRRAGCPDTGRSQARAMRLELDRVAELPDGELVGELTSRLESVEWPDWVPRVGVVRPLGRDIAVGIDPMRPPRTPKGVTCPLLAARVVSGMRGPVFMRDAAPSLSHLLDLFGGTTPSGTWELWLPVRPGTARPSAGEPSAINNAMNGEGS